MATQNFNSLRLYVRYLQWEGPIDDNLIWGNCDLYQTFCTVKKKISGHMHLFVSAKGRKLYGSKCFFHLPARLNRGQSWVVANLVGLVWWKIKTCLLERTNSAAEQWANSVLSGFPEILSGFIYTNFFFSRGTFVDYRTFQMYVKYEQSSVTYYTVLSINDEANFEGKLRS